MTILSDEQLKDLVNCTPDQGVVDAGAYQVIKSWLNPHILHIDVYEGCDVLIGETIEKWLIHAINGRIVEAVRVKTDVDEQKVIDRWTVEGIRKDMRTAKVDGETNA